jgi:O-antigen ligase
METIFKMSNSKVKQLASIDIRFLFLIGLLIFLPALEAPKNIFAFLFVVSWVVIAKNSNDWGGKWLIIDSIFLLWGLAAIFVSINAAISHQFPWGGFKDITRFVLIAWVISRTNFSRERLFQLAFFSVIAVILALIYGYYAGHGELKELYSVGHINHTAIYLLISYAISLALLLFNFDNLKTYQKITLILTTIVLFFTTIDTGSSAAFGILLLITSLDFLYLVIRVKKLTLLLAILAVVTFIGVYFVQNPPWALTKYLAKDQFLGDSGRDKINEFSYYAYKTNPILGVGFKNYSQIKKSDIKDAVLKDKGFFDNDLYLKAAHAHNVYYTYLTSGGLLIFSIFAWFWFYIVWVLIKLRTRRENKWIFVSSISVVMVNLGIGFFNTTLHHEHAVLTMFVLGLLIAQLRKSESNKELVE